MDVERVGTREAMRLLDDGYRYVDVRTPEEYAAGHPAGARNVPFMLRIDGRLSENEAFVAVMQRAYAAEAPLVIGCATGQRSLAAAKQLLAAGFATIVELRPGYAGIRDPFGQVLEKGWLAEGLPTELTTEGGSYEEVRRVE